MLQIFRLGLGLYLTTEIWGRFLSPYKAGVFWVLQIFRLGLGLYLTTEIWGRFLSPYKAGVFWVLQIFHLGLGLCLTELPLEKLSQNSR